MPYCEYCKRSPYLTYCPSFFSHINSCRQSYEMGRKRYREEKENAERKKARYDTPPVVIININITQQQLYLDYPSTDLTKRGLELANTCDVSMIKSEGDLNKIVDRLYDMQGGVIERCLDKGNALVKSQVLSFMADVMRRIRMRMEKEVTPQTVLIEAVEDFEKACIEDKQKLLPTVEDI